MPKNKGGASKGGKAAKGGSKGRVDYNLRTIDDVMSYI